MHPFQRVALATSFSVILAISASAESLILYPTTNAAIQLTTPDGWKLTQASTEGEFSTLAASGAPELHLRVLSGTIGEVVKKSTKEFMGKFNDFELGPIQKISGEGTERQLATATGKMKDDGDPATVKLLWVQLPGEKVAEVWYDIEVGEVLGVDVVQKVLESVTLKK